MLYAPNVTITEFVLYCCAIVTYLLQEPWILSLYDSYLPAMLRLQMLYSRSRLIGIYFLEQTHIYKWKFHRIIGTKT